MDCEFYCSKRARKNTKKSKHRLSECYESLMIILANNPEYGVSVQGTDGLRKMRVKVPALNVGKSGGYRLIYKACVIDEVWKIALFAAFFKGDCDDLSANDYKEIAKESDEIFERDDELKWFQK